MNSLLDSLPNFRITNAYDDIQIFEGDCLEIASLLKPGAFTLLLTSTPYPGQRGFDLSVMEYMGWWLARFELLVTRLSPTGVLVQIVSFKRTDNGWYDTHIFAIPHMLEQMGLGCQDIYIWDKLNAPPSGNHDRHDRPEYEYCFVYAKSKDYTFNPQRVPYSPKTIGKAKTGNMRKADVAGSHAGGHAEIHPDGARQGNVLRISASGDQNRPRVKGGVFPREQADRFILTYTNPGDLVLDPFMGSGTVLVQSLIHGRRAVGIDIDKEACDTAVDWVRDTLVQGVQDRLPLE